MLPTFTPFLFHWYTGVVPPFVLPAVKVREVAGQIVVEVVAIAMVGIMVVDTFITMLLLVAVSGTAQDKVELITQEIVSPLARVLSM